MFWGIFITIATATLFWSWRLLLVAIFCGAVSYFLIKNTHMHALLWYVSGVILAGVALRYMYVGFFSRQEISLDGTLHGVVLDQRSIDTRVISIEDQQILLRSKRHLTVGEQVVFQTRITPASMPLLSWHTITIPEFLVDEFGFDRWLAMKTYLGRGAVSEGQIAVRSSDVAPLSIVSRLRYIYKELVLQTFGSPPTAALFLGLTTGDRSGFSRQTYTSFVDSGLVHLLAVSGSNVVYVSLLLGIVLFRVPFYIRISLIGIVLVMYGLFCGADSSVIRAISMGIIGLVATWVGRSVDVWRLLQLVAAGMLLRNPLILWYDLGFLLSFGAVIGIVLIADQYRGWRKNTPSRWYDTVFLGWLLPSLGATTGVLPILILRTGKMSLSSIGINLLVVPLVPVFLVLGGVEFVVGELGSISRLLDRMSGGLLSLASWGSTQGMFLFVSGILPRLVFVGVFVLVLVFGRRSTSSGEEVPVL